MNAYVHSRVPPEVELHLVNPSLVLLPAISVFNGMKNFEMLFYAITVTLYEANTTFTVKRFHPTVLSTSMEKHPLRLTIAHYLITNA